MRLRKHSQQDGVRRRLSFSAWWTMGRRKEGRQWGEEVRTLLLNVQPTIPCVYLFIFQTLQG